MLSAMARLRKKKPPKTARKVYFVALGASLGLYVSLDQTVMTFAPSCGLKGSNVAE